MQMQNNTGPIFGIWFGLAGVAFGLAIYGSETNTDITGLLALAMFFALLTTIMVIVLPYLAEMSQTKEKEKAKTKRGEGDGLASLMAILDEDERAAFKQAMQQRVLEQLGKPSEDGELPTDAETLADLLHGQRSARR